MNSKSVSYGREFSATRSLLRLYDAEVRTAERAFLGQQRRLMELRRELKQLEARCSRAVASEESAGTVRVRRVLAGFFESKAAMKRTLRVERGKSLELLATLRDAHARHDAVKALAKKRLQAREELESRREETLGNDLVSSGRIALRRGTGEIQASDLSNTSV